MYEVDQALRGGELSLSVCPGWEIDLQKRKELQIPGGVPWGEGGGGAVSWLQVKTLLYNFPAVGRPVLPALNGRYYVSPILTVFKKSNLEKRQPIFAESTCLSVSQLERRTSNARLHVISVEWREISKHDK